MEHALTRIDFHSNVPDKIQYACRLVRKARAANCRIVLLARASDLASLDLALWALSDDAFLPHVMAGDPLAAQTPIVLTDSVAVALPHHHVLINLSDATPEHFARFERMFEVISADEGDKTAGRERFRFYKQRGYPLTHNVAEPA